MNNNKKDTYSLTLSTFKKKPRLKARYLHPLNDLPRLDPNHRIGAKIKKNPKQITIISIK